MIWFDLDNSPHVPLFRPILKELERRNIPVDITARDFAQTASLLKYWNISHTMIGSHGGKNIIKKLVNLYTRSNQLRRHISGKPVSLAVSHGSRTQVVAAKRSGIPSVLMLDYEYTEAKIFNLFSTYLLMPEYIPSDLLKRLGFNMRKLIRYPGFKEEIYLQDFSPIDSFRATINIPEDVILVTVRPPSIVGNYHDARSEKLFVEIIEHLSSHPSVRCLLVSRIKEDLLLIPKTIRERGNILVLDKPVDGLQLLWNSDIVISGGGTMNRESALLGVPTFSIFTGNKPFLDHFLEDQGKISFISKKDDIHMISVLRRLKPSFYKPIRNDIVAIVTDTLLSLNK